jgi:cysteine desulfurase
LSRRRNTSGLQKAKIFSNGTAMGNWTAQRRCAICNTGRDLKEAQQALRGPNARIGMTRLYVDHNATAPLRPQAREAMLQALDLGGNPSSVHGEGRAAKRLMEDSRETLAGALACAPDAITFTGGATEALQLAMDSAKAMGFGPVYLSSVEHDAVWAYATRLWPDAVIVPVNENALIDRDWLAAKIAADGGKPLLIMQGANNETGTIQPLDRLSTLVRAAGGAVLCDGVQMLGKLPASHFAGSTDWFVVSSHKIGGPSGAGALVAAPGIVLANTRPGGGQERGARAGTENVAAVAGFAAAAQEACSDEAVLAYQSLVQSERNAFEAAIAEGIGGLVIVSQTARRLANTSCVATPNWEAARQVMALDLAGFAVSAGSACSSGKVKTSRVLAACGYGPEVAGCAIRASFGWNTQIGDGDLLAKAYLKAGARYINS